MKKDNNNNSVHGQDFS